MKRCPKCKRFGIEINLQTKKEECTWRDCLWINITNIDLNKFNYGINFKKFSDSISKTRED
jgi:hypothetical protein